RTKPPVSTFQGPPPCHSRESGNPGAKGSVACPWTPRFRGGDEDEWSQQLAAIDRDRLTGDPAGERRGEERHDLRHLLRAAEPAERDAMQDGAVQRRVRGLAALPSAAGKFDRPRRHAVDAD